MTARALRFGSQECNQPLFFRQPVAAVSCRVRTRGVPATVELVWIENITNRGARIRTHRAWQEREQLVLTGMLGDFRADAEVVYCQRLGPEECAIGQRFEHPVATEQLTYTNPWS